MHRVPKISDVVLTIEDLVRNGNLYDEPYQCFDLPPGGWQAKESVTWITQWNYYGVILFWHTSNHCVLESQLVCLTYLENNLIELGLESIFQQQCIHHVISLQLVVLGPSLPPTLCRLLHKVCMPTHGHWLKNLTWEGTKYRSQSVIGAGEMMSSSIWFGPRYNIEVLTRTYLHHYRRCPTKLGLSLIHISEPTRPY